MGKSFCFQHTRLTRLSWEAWEAGAKQETVQVHPGWGRGGGKMQKKFRGGCQIRGAGPYYGMMDGGWAPSGSNEMEPEPRRMNASDAPFPRPVDRTGRAVLRRRGKPERCAPGRHGRGGRVLRLPRPAVSAIVGSAATPRGQPRSVRRTTEFALANPIVPRKSGQFRSERWMQDAHVRTSLLIFRNGPVQSLLGKTRRGFP